MSAVKERPILFSCRACKVSMPRTIEHFGRDSKSAGGLRTKCKSCVSAVKKDHYMRTRPEQRARQRAYQEANRDRLYAYNRGWSTKRRAALRSEMLTAYGGACACCGEQQPMFLQLDHVNNDGAVDRRRFKNNEQHWLTLRAKGWPRDRFQLLCANCNFGKLMNGGVCPHKTEEHDHA